MPKGVRRLPSMLLVVILAASACTSTNAPSSPPTNVDLPLEIATLHFRLHYDNATRLSIAAYASALEGSWARITGHLAQPNLDPIEGRFYPTQVAFTAATGYNATGSVEGPNLFHVVGVPFSAATPIHEFTHNVALHLNPSAGNNPVWLWESVAVYEANQFVSPASLSYLVARQFPTLAQLSDRASPYSVYDVGYVLMEFMVDRWGWTGIRALIAGQGDIAQVFGMTATDFERAWREFVVRRYLGG